MGLHKIKRGLDVPIAGEPRQVIENAPSPSRVSLLAADYEGLRPTMFVRVGDAVRRGQPLFEDKKNPGVVFTSPGAGEVVAVNRGERRALRSVTIALNERERALATTDEDATDFESYRATEAAALTREQVQDLLMESGVWTAFRTRPFSKVPPVRSVPHSIFITAIDTNPLAARPEVALAGREQDFERGVVCVSKLTDGPVYLCKAPGSSIPAPGIPTLRIEEFSGKHPAGTVGLHIHRLDPVNRGKIVWHLNYQDVAMIGRLFATGKLDVDRVIALGGPIVSNPRLLRTRIGASTDALTANETTAGVGARIISGSVLSGRQASGAIEGYLGRYHLQISALEEGTKREFLGWLWPWGEKFSILKVFTSSFQPQRKIRFDTNINGSPRAMVPVGTYEKVVPFDIYPTYLLRALIIGDLERAEALGCLELDEEDLALCTFVCPGKYEYGPILRRNLAQIEKEG